MQYIVYVAKGLRHDLRKRVSDLHSRRTGSPRGANTWFARHLGVSYTTVWRWWEGRVEVPSWLPVHVAMLERDADIGSSNRADKEDP